MANLVALCAAVFSLYAKNLREADNRPPAVRGLKHESNKKYLGMSSKVPPFALSQINWLPQAGMRSRSHSRKKQGSCGSERGVPTIFCKDATMAQKNEQKTIEQKSVFARYFCDKCNEWYNNFRLSGTHTHGDFDLATGLREKFDSVVARCQFLMRCVPTPQRLV